MTSHQYREAIAALGLNQAEAASLLGVDARTSRRWACDERDVPMTVARFLRLMLALKLTPARVHKILDRTETSTEREARAWSETKSF